MRKVIWLTGLLFAGSTGCGAQVFIPTDSVRWHLRLAVTGAYSDGNAPRALLGNVLEVSHLGPRLGLVTRQSYQYGTIRYKLTNSDVLSTNYLLLLPRRKVVPFVRFEVETNKLRKISWRYQPSGGLIHKLMAAPGQAINLFVAACYEHTRYDGTGFNYIKDNSPAANDTDVLATWRGQLGLNGQNKLFAGKVALAYNAWWQQSVQDLFDYRYHADGSFSFRLTTRLSFTTAARYTYEKIELNGIRPFDLQWTYGLTVANF